MNGNIPCMFDRGTDPVVHLLLFWSSMVEFILLLKSSVVDYIPCLSMFQKC